MILNLRHKMTCLQFYVLPFLIYLLFSQQANAELKALLIGNSEYKSSILPNLDDVPVRDANAIASVLLEAGFAKKNITIKLNLSYAQFVVVLHEYRNSLNHEDYGFIYFSGHGFSVNGVSYLAPVDLMAEKGGIFAAKHAIPLQRLIDDTSNVSVRGIIIDACRDGASPVKGRSQHNVIATMENVENKSDGTIIEYATRGGEKAKAGSPGGQLSFFTYYFIDVMTKTPHPPDLATAMLAARNATYAGSDGKQAPEIDDGLIGIYFFPAFREISPPKPLTNTAPSQAAASPSHSTPISSRDDLPFVCPPAGQLYDGWRIVKDQRDRSVYLIISTGALSASHSRYSDTLRLNLNSTLESALSKTDPGYVPIPNSMLAKMNDLFSELNNLVVPRSQLRAITGKVSIDSYVDLLEYDSLNKSLSVTYRSRTHETNQEVPGGQQAVSISNISLSSQTLLNQIGNTVSEVTDEWCDRVVSQYVGTKQ